MVDIEISLRLLLSFLFGTVVGIERQWHHKTAGLKTVALVGLGATAFGLISVHVFGLSSNPGQVASGVITGIGFIGAGVIIRRGGSVQGINSAATLWATASMGLAIGCGYYTLGWQLFLLIVAAQFLLRWIANGIDRRSGFLPLGATYQVAVAFDPSAAQMVDQSWASFINRTGVSVLECRKFSLAGSNSNLVASLYLSEQRAKELNVFHQALREIHGVTSTEWSIKGSIERD